MTGGARWSMDQLLALKRRTRNLRALLEAEKERAADSALVERLRRQLEDAECEVFDFEVSPFTRRYSGRRLPSPAGTKGPSREP